MHDLATVFPNVYLWLRSEDVDEEFNGLLGEAAAKTDAASIWSISSETAKNLLDRLYEGGWAMFFLKSALETIGFLPDKLETRPEGLLQLMSQIGADATLVSWYDDTEWLISFRNPRDFFSNS